MKYLYTVLGVVLFILLLGFALKNAQPVELNYYLGLAWRAPMSLLLFITFFCGALLGMVACITPLIRQRRRLLALQRELEILNSNAQ
ncbi:MAG TPA: LapA family protein [Methylophilaceae bacterium]|nr:LapA family protein [Methylophilaceae bacterium]